MSILHAAWELDTVDTLVGTVGESNQTYTRDTNYTNIALYAQGGIREGVLPFTSAASDIWLHYNVLYEWTGVVSTDSAYFEYRNAGIAAYRIAVLSATKKLAVQRTSDGTTWTTVVSWTVPIDAGTSGGIQYCDVRIKPHATDGIVRVYLSGMLIASYDGPMVAQAYTIDNIRVTNGSGAVHWLSEIIVADEPTIGWRLQTLTPNGAGLYSEWTGAYTEVDDTLMNESDFIVVNTTGQRFTAEVTNPTSSLGSREIKAVVVATRISRSADATPTDAQHMIRSNGGDYTSASLGLTGDGSHVNKQTIFATNPSTGNKFTTVEATNMQVGVKSV